MFLVGLGSRVFHPQIRVLHDVGLIKHDMSQNDNDSREYMALCQFLLYKCHFSTTLFPMLLVGLGSTIFGIPMAVNLGLNGTA